MKNNWSSRCSFIHSHTSTNPYIPCTPLLQSLTIYLAIYLNSQLLVHYCLTLHLPSLFISVIIKLHFLPLYSSPSHPHFLSLFGVHYRAILLSSTGSPGWRRQDKKEGRREGRLKDFSWDYFFGLNYVYPYSQFYSTNYVTNTPQFLACLIP